MDNEEKIEMPILAQIEEYGKNMLEIIKLKVIKKSSVLFSKLIFNFIFLIIMLMFISCVSIGVALWLGEYIGNMSYGFYCVAFVYAFLGVVIFFLFPNWITLKIRNGIINELLD